MTGSIFEPLPDGRFAPTEAALGPWSDQALHGGPPMMLLAREIERFPLEGRVFVARMTVELLRPTDRSPLRVRARLVRPGRKVQLVEASMWRDEVEVARATALCLRRSRVEVAEHDDPPPHPFLDDRGEWEPPYRAGHAYHLDGVEIRATGGDRERGPTWAWFRLRLPLVPGEEPSPLVRACAAADFPNGISYVVDPARVSYINPDVTLTLHRLPVGEWVLMDARTWLEPHGVGMAEGALYDRTGRIGRSVQALLVEPRG